MTSLLQAYKLSTLKCDNSFVHLPTNKEHATAVQEPLWWWPPSPQAAPSPSSIIMSCWAPKWSVDHKRPHALFTHTTVTWHLFLHSNCLHKPMSLLLRVQYCPHLSFFYDKKFPNMFTSTSLSFPMIVFWWEPLD